MAEIVMYGLTTCPHCKRTRKFLEEMGVDFEIVWIDKLEGDERKKTIKRVHEISGSYSVPLVVKGSKFVLGFNKEKLMELIKGD